MKTSKVLLLSAIFLLTGCTVRQATTPNTTGESVALPIIEKTEGSDATLQSPSLPELFEKEFDGRDLKLGEVLARTDTYTRYYITYKSGELTISGILNVPHGSGPFPIVLLNHGYIDPKIYTNGRGLKREQDYFARNGYVVLHSDYRNHAQSDKDDETEQRFRLGYTEDVINAVYALKASGLPYLDTNRIGMLGHSMGGGVTENVIVVQPDLIDAAILFAPVSADVRDNFNRWTRSRPEVVKTIIERYGEPTTSPAFWNNVSPINFTERIAVPVMIHHGTADESCELEWSRRYEQALKDADKNVTLHVYDGEPHEFAVAWPTVMKRSLDFLNQHLK